MHRADTVGVAGHRFIIQLRNFGFGVTVPPAAAATTTSGNLGGYCCSIHWLEVVCTSVRTWIVDMFRIVVLHYLAQT
jgi:hypothetical protein